MIRLATPPECRNCNTSVPVDEHFCPNCDRILSLGRHGDYFAFFGLPRKLVVDAADLDRRFRDLSRKFHPDFFYNAPSSDRLASLERSSYLNDAYRALRQPVSRIEHLLSIEGLPVAKPDSGLAGGAVGGASVPPGLLEEVFALNEELDEIREARESGADPARLAARLEAARRPIEEKRDEHERRLNQTSALWDTQDAAPVAERRATLESLRELLLERNYITNLLATIEREAAAGG